MKFDGKTVPVGLPYAGKDLEWLIKNQRAVAFAYIRLGQALAEQMGVKKETKEAKLRRWMAY